MRQLLLIGWVIAVAASLPLPAQSAPIRVLVYHFDVDAHGFGSSRSIANGGVMDYGTSSVTYGGTGTLTVNVQAATQDGGLVVDVIEHMDRVDRPFQTVRCAIYENPDQVICDQNLAKAGYVTEELQMLLTYLGRGFYNSSRLDAKNHWQTKEDLNGGTGSIVCDYTVTKTDGDVLTISVNRDHHDGPYQKNTSGTLQYDPKMTDFSKAHFVSDVADSGATGGSTVSFDLISDSFASH